AARVRRRTARHGSSRWRGCWPAWGKSSGTEPPAGRHEGHQAEGPFRMAGAIESWGRLYFTPGGGDAFLFYAPIGDVGAGPALERKRYRSGGVPRGFQLMQCERDKDAEAFGSFLAGHAWEQLRRDDPALAGAVETAPRCVVLRGTQKDPRTLDYLRD